MARQQQKRKSPKKMGKKARNVAAQRVAKINRIFRTLKGGK